MTVLLYPVPWAKPSADIISIDSLREWAYEHDHTLCGVLSHSKGAKILLPSLLGYRVHALRLEPWSYCTHRLSTESRAHDTEHF